MLNLPKSTEFNKRIPKQKFYENLTVTPALKRAFAEQIKAVYWRNKIAAQTMNLAAGESVLEIEIFEVRLTSRNIEESLLRQIDREIPYHIIFLTEYEGTYRAWAAYKEKAAAGGNAFTVGAYYSTKWLAEAELPLKAEGLNLDTVYENFVRQIAGNALQARGSENLKESVERAELRLQLERQISALQGKINKEKQLNKQVRMNTELKKLKKALEELWKKMRMESVSIAEQNISAIAEIFPNCITGAARVVLFID